MELLDAGEDLDDVRGTRRRRARASVIEDDDEDDEDEQQVEEQVQGVPHAETSGRRQDALRQRAQP